MGFSLKAILPPLTIWVVYSLYVFHHPHLKNWMGLYTVIFGWLLVSCAVVVIYWLVRVFRRASDDFRPRR